MQPDAPDDTNMPSRPLSDAEWEVLDGLLMDAGIPESAEVEVVRDGVQMRKALEPFRVQAFDGAQFQAGVDAKIDAGWQERKTTGLLRGIQARGLGAQTLRGNPIQLAAVVTTALMIGVGIFTTWLSARPGAHHTIAYIYATSTSGPETIHLPDGTPVVLGPQTRLQYTTSGSTSARTVFLHGQAYFMVGACKDQPFVVHIAHTTIHVLGTAFEVRKYPTDPVVRVVVANGKVAVQTPTVAGGRAVVATEHMMIQVSDSGQISRTSNVAVDDKLAWITGRLVFRATPVTQVAAELEQRYHVTIQFADSALAADRVTASLSTESVTEVLDYLAIALNARYTRVGRIVTFTPARPLLHAVPMRRSLTSESSYGR